MRTLLPLALSTVALLESTAVAGGMYGVGVSGDYGTALVLPTSSAVTSTSLSYREIGGALGNLIIFVGLIPVCGMTQTSTRYETDDVGHTYEITTTTTASQATKDACAGVVTEWWDTVGKRALRGEFGQDLQLDIPLRQLGGNTSGASFSMWRPVRSPTTDEMIPVLGEGSQLWIAQFHLAYLTFHDVTSRRAIAENGTIRTMEVTGNQDYVLVGSGVRAYKLLTDNFRAMLQVDLNVMSIVDDEPSPIRLGIDWVVPHVLFHLEAVTSGINPSGFGINAQVMLAI